MLQSVEVPSDFERRLREDFLAGYLAEVDASLLPSDENALERLLRLFELEKAVYELRYELDNRPDWVAIPVAAIEQLLDGAAGPIDVCGRSSPRAATVVRASEECG